MPPIVALLFGVVFVLYAFYTDRKRDVGDTKDLFWPSLWYVVVATRPLGIWLEIWGIHLPGAEGTDATDGSFIDRVFYGGLTVIGIAILARRRFDWGATLRANSWMTAFFVYMALSILWSHYPFVSLKRYIKVLGSVVMAFVILTGDHPLDSMFTVLRRCLYVHLPMSIICTRYFRDIGVAFDWAGTAESWQGVATSKNTLGQIAMLGVLYFFWEVRRNWPKYGIRNLHVIYLLMALYLLKGGPGAVSMTSISVCAIAVVIFLRIQALRYRPASVRGFVLTAFGLIATLGSFVVVHSVAMFSADSIFGKMITLFGRDITLTDRTFIWHDVYSAAASNPLFGVGFGGFWIGRMSNIPWNAQMTWILGQAHNGYVDTYLQLGVVGVVLLLCVFFTTLPRLLDSLTEDFDLGCFRITMFLTILFINITESVYLRGDHHLWLIFQVVLWAIPPDGTGIDSRRSEYEVSRASHAPDHSATPSEPLKSLLGGI